MVLCTFKDDSDIFTFLFIVDFPTMNWQKYHRLGTIYAYMHRLQLRFPELVEVITIGRTDQGRDILVAKVGQINSVYPKKAIFIEAGVFPKRFIGIGNKCVKS